MIPERLSAGGITVIEPNEAFAWFQVDYELLGKCGLGWAQKLSAEERERLFEDDQETALNELMNPTSPVVSDIMQELAAGRAERFPDSIEKKPIRPPEATYPGGMIGFMDLRFPITHEEASQSSTFARYPSWKPVDMAAAKIFVDFFRSSGNKLTDDVKRVELITSRAYHAVTSLAFSESESEYTGFKPELFPYRVFSVEMSQKPEIAQYRHGVSRAGKALLDWEMYDRLLPANY